MDAADKTHDAAASANELYWGSDRSVNQIAEALDLSKGALYGLIRPLASGRSCPVCGGEVVWANRTAQVRGRLSCPDCAWEGTADEAGDDEVAAATPTLPELWRKAPAVEDREHGSRVLFDGNRSRTVIGGALLGAAVGLALVFWARRRS
jgi:hypothetical protein